MGVVLRVASGDSLTGSFDKFLKDFAIAFRVSFTKNTGVRTTSSRSLNAIVDSEAPCQGAQD